MVRMPARHLSCLVATFLIGAIGGCSDDSAPKLDQKAAIDKVAGGEGSARQSPKAKAASEEAAKVHPKLH